jgi:hypothetical protein
MVRKAPLGLADLAERAPADDSELTLRPLDEGALRAVAGA